MQAEKCAAPNQGSNDRYVRMGLLQPLCTISLGKTKIRVIAGIRKAIIDA